MCIRDRGQIKDWRAHGSGQLTTAAGDIHTGQFSHGLLEGEARIDYADGARYEGNVSFGQPDGRGVKTHSNKSVYTGEFSYGVYHGKGKLASVDEQTKQWVVQKGIWEQGSLVHDQINGSVLHEQAEIALETHQARLVAQLKDIPSGLNDQVDWFFLAVAGDGSQSVFRREVEFARQIFVSRYGNADRTISLVNHRGTADLYPLATRRSIQQSLQALAEKMDREQDILFLYMTSHGSHDYKFYLNHNSIQLPPISASELGTALQDSGIKNQVIVISACYAGGFIPELQNENAMILTAADESSQSFGCSDESEMTYFAKALLKETLQGNSEITLAEAFEQASVLVTRWEQEQDLTPSNPQFFAGEELEQKLQSLPALLDR